MSIPVTCTCGQSFRAKPELAGKRVKCPTCGSVLQIPMPAQPTQPAQPAPPLDDPNDPLGLGGFNEQAVGAPLPQMPGSQPLQSPLPSYSAPKPKRDWGPIIRIGLIGGGVLLVIGVLVAGALIAWSYLGGYRSPEAVFAAAKEAAEEEDWERFCGCITPESRDQFAGVLVFFAVITKGASGMAAFGGPDRAQEAEEKMKPVMDVMAKHGLDEDTLKNMSPQGPMGPGGPDKDHLQEMLAPIKNRNKFIADMITVMKEVGNREDSIPSPWESDARLEDVETGEDSATGYVVQTKNGNERRNKIAFAKVDGSWRIDLPGSVGR